MKSFNNMIKIICKLFVRAMIAAIFVLSTTFGWFNLNVDQPVDPVVALNLKEIVTYLSENIGVRNYARYSNLNKTADFIITEFEEFGYDVVIQSYEVKGKTFKNIIAEVKGIKSDKEFIVVGAHYDSCFNPGADDNASGIAGLIEMARMIKEKQLDVGVRFIAFTNEEPPFFQTDLMGSRVYTASLKEEKENIKGAIILEMIGYYSDNNHSQRYPPLIGPFYPNKGNYIAVVGNFHSNKLVKKVTRNFKKHSSFPVERIVAPSCMPGLNFSDHWSFWEEGIQAVMITDTAYMRNKHYHQATDLPETLNYQNMALVVAAMTASIIDLAHQ
ncbi:M28 family peptidase [Candidatus Omnitrophota bacterium]